MAGQSLNELFEAGIRAHRSGRLQEAAQLYRHVLSYDANNVLALSNLGQLLAQFGEYEQSEALIKQAMSRAPDFVHPYISLSVVLHAQERFADAINCCEQGLKVSPDNKQLLNTLASSLTGAGKFEEAIALLTKMTAAHPGYALGHHGIGEIYAKLGNCAEAAKAFKKAAAINPKDANSIVAAAECLMKIGEAADALRQIDRALRVNPYEVRALGLKTLALAELGRASEEEWLSDPHRFVHTFRLADIGYGADDAARLNDALSAFAARDESMRKDPPEYTTYNGWHSTTNLAERGDPAVEALKKLIGQAFERRIEHLSREDPAHPFVRHAPRKYRLDLWAVKMLGGGKMYPHIHPDGWLSGVYYIDVPSIVDDPKGNEAGWIKFGTPRIDIRLTKKTMTRTVKPERGLMVTFPSYFWHDTVPLPADNQEQRLCLSFDLQPIR